MSKSNPNELYGNLSKDDEADLRKYFAYAMCYEVEGAIAIVKKFSSNKKIKEEDYYENDNEYEEESSLNGLDNIF